MFHPAAARHDRFASVSFRLAPIGRSCTDRAGLPHIILLVSLLTQAPLLPVAAVANASGSVIATTVRGIVSFTRWPTQPNPIHLCLIGPTRMGDGDLARLSSTTHTMQITHLPESVAVVPPSCDMLYFGMIAAQRLPHLLAQGHARPLLTVAEEDPLCRGGAMFCLHVRHTAVSFELNLDAVSRSGVSVDPRVLRLSSGGPR